MTDKTREKAEAHQFTLATSLTPEQIVAAGNRAAEAGKRTLQSRIVLAGNRQGRLDYRIAGPGGVVTQMQFVVTWVETPGGTRTVSLGVGDFITAQSRFIFIPVGPKTVPALGALGRFSQWLQKELTTA